MKISNDFQSILLWALLPQALAARTRLGSSSSTGQSGLEAAQMASDERTDDHLLECAGYVGVVYGDPHLATFDSVRTTCQASGEFTLVESQDDILVQARFEALGGNAVSVTSGIAVQVDGTDTIQVSFAEYESGNEIYLGNDCPMHVYVNGVLQSSETLLISGSNYDVSIEDTSVNVQYTEDGSPTYAITVQTTATRVGDTCMITAYVCLPSSKPEVLEQTVGLLGTPDNDTTDEWTTSTGDVLTYSTDSQERFDYCTTYHCVSSKDESIFVYEDENGGKAFEDLMNCNEEFPGDVDISNPDPEVVEICGEDNLDCILDGTVAGTEGAESSAATQETIDAIHVSNTTVDTTPHSVCPEDIVLVHTQGEVIFDQIPLVVVEQNTDHVVLEWRTTFFAGAETLYVEYEQDFYQICLDHESALTDFSEQIIVSCPTSEHVALVNVVTSDSRLDAELNDAELSVCCHAFEDTKPKVKHTFLVSCVPLCPEDSRRRLRSRAFRN